MLRLERHELGPRIYLLGQRIHEFAFGFFVLVALLPLAFTDHWELTTKRYDGLAAFGVWLVVKDWRDLFPSKRNTGAWSLLPHRVPARQQADSESR